MRGSASLGRHGSKRGGSLGDGWDTDAEGLTMGTMASRVRLLRVGTCSCGRPLEQELDTDGMGHVIGVLVACPCGGDMSRAARAVLAMECRRLGVRPSPVSEVVKMAKVRPVIVHKPTPRGRRQVGKMYLPEQKVAALRELLLKGLSANAAGSAVGCSRRTAMKVRARVIAEVGDIKCGCGRSALHRGPCKYRVKHNPVKILPAGSW